jgi:hypothetical protein
VLGDAPPFRLLEVRGGDGRAHSVLRVEGNAFDATSYDAADLAHASEAVRRRLPGAQLLDGLQTTRDALVEALHARGLPAPEAVLAFQARWGGIVFDEQRAALGTYAVIQRGFPNLALVVEGGRSAICIGYPRLLAVSEEGTFLVLWDDLDHLEEPLVVAAEARMPKGCWRPWPSSRRERLRRRSTRPSPVTPSRDDGGSRMHGGVPVTVHHSSNALPPLGERTVTLFAYAAILREPHQRFVDDRTRVPFERAARADGRTFARLAADADRLVRVAGPAAHSSLATAWRGHRPTTIDAPRTERSHELGDVLQPEQSLDARRVERQSRRRAWREMMPEDRLVPCRRCRTDDPSGTWTIGSTSAHGGWRSSGKSTRRIAAQFVAFPAIGEAGGGVGAIPVVPGRGAGELGEHVERVVGGVVPKAVDQSDGAG